MAYRFLFVMDPLERVLPDKDTTFVFMLESLNRGHAVYYCELHDLFTSSTGPHARVCSAEVRRGTPHYILHETATEALDTFDAIFMRKDPPVDQAYLFATYILGLVDPRRCFVVNRPSGLRDANEKLYALHFPEFTPETLVTSDRARLLAFLDDLGGQMIVKPLDGCGGAGVFLVERRDRNLHALLETATDYGRRLTMAQRYLPAVRSGDKRVIVLNGEALGAVLRVPRVDEHRGNIHVGGSCEAATLTDLERHMVATLAPRLVRDGLYFVGLDIIGERLTEINVTSPTGIQEINALDGTCLEARVIDFIEARVASGCGE